MSDLQTDKNNLLEESEKEKVEINNNDEQQTEKNNTSDSINNDSNTDQDKIAQNMIEPVPWTNNIFRKDGAIGWLKGIGFLLILFSTAYFGSLFFVFVSVPFLFLAPRIYRKWNDILSYWWFHLPVAFCEYVFKVKFVITGDKIDPNDKASIFIANHRTRLDWLFLWTYFFQQGRLANEKIVLKYPLKLVPGFGWAMQAFTFLFLRRKRQLDNDHMHALFKYFADSQYPVQFLLFPEGTDYGRSSVSRGFKYSKSQGWDTYHYVLHPRTGAYSVAFEELSKSNLDSVYDITMGYPDVIPQGEKEIASGNFPYTIYIDVKRYARSELPEADETKNDEWVRQIWKEKETKLEKFYKNKTTLDDENKLRSEQTPEELKEKTFSIQGSSLFQVIVAVVSWILYLLFAPYLFFTTTTGFWWFIISNIFFVAVSYSGGLELFELSNHHKTQSQTKHKIEHAHSNDNTIQIPDTDNNDSDQKKDD